MAQWPSYVSVKTTSPCALDPQGAGAVHGQVTPPGDEEAGTAEGRVTHHYSLRGTWWQES